MENYYVIREVPVCKKFSMENSTKLLYEKLPINWDFQDYSGAFQPQQKIGEDICGNESVLLLENNDFHTIVEVD